MKELEELIGLEKGYKITEAEEKRDLKLNTLPHKYIMPNVQERTTPKTTFWSFFLNVYHPSDLQKRRFLL